MSIFNFFERNPEIREKDYRQTERKHGKDVEKKSFKERLENASNIELKGFPSKEKYKNLTPEQRREKIREEKVKYGQALDGEQMRVFLKDIMEKIPTGTKEFLEKNCTITLDKDSTGGSIEVGTLGNKVNITLDPKSFLKEGQIIGENGKFVEVPQFHPEKAAFLIGWAIGTVLEPPPDWKEKCYKVEVIRGRIGEWADYVGLYLSNPGQAEKIFPEAYKLLRQRFQEIGDDTVVKKIEKIKFKDGELAPDFRSDKDKSAQIPKGEGLYRNFMFNLMQAKDSFVRFRTIFQEAYWKKTTWYQRAVAEFEDKEMARIIKQNEGAPDRLKQLAQVIGDGKSNTSWENQFQIRTLLLSLVKTGDFRLEIIDDYLQSCDDLFRKTHGERITEASYNFIVRLHRMSNESKRIGTKIAEYRRIEPGEKYSYYENGKTNTAQAPETLYVRKDRKTFQREVLEENMTFSNRDFSNIAKEALDYLKVGGRYISIGGDKWEKVGQAFDGNEDNKYLTPPGDERFFVGGEFADLKHANVNYREILSKMEPDQIAMLARIYAEQIKVDADHNQRLPIFSKEILGEHAKPTMTAAYNHYKDVFLTDPELRSYVDYYLDTVGLELNVEGKYTFDEKYRYDYKKNPGTGDKETINNYIERETIQKRNLPGQSSKEGAKQFLRDSHNLVEEYIIEPDMESLNEEFNKRILKENAAALEKKVGALEKSVRYYKEEIQKILEKNLPLEAQKIVAEKLGDPSLTKEEFIIEELEEALKEELGSLPLELKRKLQTFNEIARPLRREMIRTNNLLVDLGFDHILDNIRLNVGDTDKKTVVKSNKAQFAELLIKAKRGKLSDEETKDLLRSYGYDDEEISSMSPEKREIAWRKIEIGYLIVENENSKKEEPTRQNGPLADAA